MTDTQTTQKLALPMLMAGQAQKEITHNEALALIDALLFPMAEAANVNSPPSSPLAGQCWLSGNAPTGAWSGHALSLAIWTSAGWRFAPMATGARIAVGPQQTLYQRMANSWQSAPQLASPVGGSVVDSECRSALNQVISVLISAGIAASS